MIILGVAPVPSEKGGYSASPQAVAADVLACARAGASVVHLHVRDEQGEQTACLDAFNKTLREIRAGSDIVLQGSTGGVSTLSLEERCVCLGAELVQTASLNMGSINFGDGLYCNTLPDIRYWAGSMIRAGVYPELEVFDLSMIYTARRLLEEGILPAPPVFNVALGFENALPAEIETLETMARMIGKIPGARWGFMCHGRYDAKLMAAAVALGACMVRVGYEDSGPSSAACNAELVGRAACLLSGLGETVATPCQAAYLLGVSGKQ